MSMTRPTAAIKSSMKTEYKTMILPMIMSEKIMTVVKIMARMKIDFRRRRYFPQTVKP